MLSLGGVWWQNVSREFCCLFMLQQNNSQNPLEPTLASRAFWPLRHTTPAESLFTFQGFQTPPVPPTKMRTAREHGSASCHNCFFWAGKLGFPRSSFPCVQLTYLITIFILSKVIEHVCQYSIILLFLICKIHYMYQNFKPLSIFRRLRWDHLVCEANH